MWLTMSTNISKKADGVNEIVIWEKAPGDAESPRYDVADHEDDQDEEHEDLGNKYMNILTCII